MKYLGDYFVWSWTGGGELRAFIQFFAVFFGPVAWGGAYFKMKRALR